MMFLDMKNGMAFNRRRQTQDRAVIQRLLAQFPGKCFWGDEKTKALFDGFDAAHFKADPDFLNKAAAGDVAVAEFVSSDQLKAVDRKIEQLVIYRWDKVYPADLVCTYPLAKAGWNLTKQTEFTGHSHDKITEEVYHR
ncbi:MAG: hypothetical protein ACI39G_05635 [Pseudoramibacter sp.]